MLHRFIGDRAFYRQVFRIAVPIIVQNGITNFVSLLDNIMVGQVGTIPMSGVTIINQLIFIFNLCVFGASSGAGIFTAQFHGRQDEEGVRNTFRYKMVICTLIALLFGSIFARWGDQLAGLYLTGEGDPADAGAILASAREYLKIMLWGMLPFAVCTSYASTLKERGETLVPMVSGIAAVLINLVLYFLPTPGGSGIAEAGFVMLFANILPSGLEGILAVLWRFTAEYLPFMLGAVVTIRAFGSDVINVANVKTKTKVVEPKNKA